MGGEALWQSELVRETPPLARPTGPTLTLRQKQVLALVAETGLADGRGERVLEQHGAGHRADASGHGGDPARHFLGGIEIHIAAHLGRLRPVGAGVDDDRAFFHHVRRDEPGAADRGDGSIDEAALDGVDVRLLVPGTTDIPVFQSVSRAGYYPLLDAGVRSLVGMPDVPGAPLD